MKQSIKYIGFLILMFVVFTPEAFANSLVPSSLTMVQSVPYSQVVWFGAVRVLCGAVRVLCGAVPFQSGGG